MYCPPLVFPLEFFNKSHVLPCVGFFDNCFSLSQMLDLQEAIESYATDKDKVNLPSFVAIEQNTIALHRLNADVFDWREIRNQISKDFEKFQETTKKVRYVNEENFGLHLSSYLLVYLLIEDQK